MNRKSIILALGAALLACMPVSAQTTYNFTDVNFTGDTFTQFLGINNHGIVAGYHGFAINQGFTYNVATGTFTSENFPGSVQTQVIGINNNQPTTVGFYIDKAGKTHGFQDLNGVFSTVGYPSTPFNQLLGHNDAGQASGYYSTKADGTGPDHPYIWDQFGGVFELITIPGATSAQATGIDDASEVCGFYIDAKNLTHGWLLVQGSFMPLNFPKSTFTQALGLNNKQQVVGVYMDKAGNTHGFVYNRTAKTWQSIDDPNGINTTVVNGINDKGDLVGFWGTNPLNTAFVATP